MPAPPLSHMARRACIKNVNMITDIGDADFSLVKPILVKIQNPKQLWQIEQNSPQIIGHDADLWREFCKRDIPNYEKDPQEPSNPKSWYKVYLKLHKANQQQVEKDAALLKATMDGIKSKQAENKAKQVELRGVALPPSMKTNLPQIHMPKNSSLYHKEKPMHLDEGILRYEREHGTFPTDQLHQRETHRKTTVKPTTSSSKLMAKFRKDTLAGSRFSIRRPTGVIATRDMRTKQLPTKTTIVAAPRSMIDQHRKAPAASTTNPLSPSRKRPIDQVATSESEKTDLEAREKRLKSMKSVNGPQVSSSPPPLKTGSTASGTPNRRSAEAKSTSPPARVMRRPRASSNPMVVPVRKRKP